MTNLNAYYKIVIVGKEDNMKRNLLILGVCSLFLVTGCFSSKTDKKTEKTSDIKVEENKVEGLEISNYYTDNKEMIFVIKNTSKELIDYASIDIALYNAKGNLMKTEKQYVRNLNVNAENVIKVNLVDYSEKGSTDLPAKVEYAINKVIYSTKFETVYSDKVEGTVTKSETDGQLNLTITNNSGVTLDDLSAAVVFYKNGKPIDLYQVNTSSVGATYTDTVYVPSVVKKETSNFITYDDAKVIINNASKTNTES